MITDLVSENPNMKYAPYERMATAIVDITKEKGGCLPQDLNERGFAPSEVVERWHMAKAMADIELKLMAA